MIEIAQQHCNEILATGSRRGYQCCVVVAGLVGGWLIRQDSAAWAVSVRQRWSIMLVALGGALLGCALPAFFAGGMVEAQAWSGLVGPKTVLGGLLGSFLLVALFKRVTHNHLDTSDAFARGTVAILMIGRVGCVLQHCCYGRPSPWGLAVGAGPPRIPVQAMEALGLCGLLLLLQHLHLRARCRGRQLFVVFALYGALRFALEFWREPVAARYLGLGFYQWLALLLCLVGLAQIVIRTLQPNYSLKTRL
ncbi:MAG: prolipoprotein diacylglyceryl transferase family protein [bacterium]